MNITSQFIMSAGYIFFIASVLPNVRQVWKNRHHLRGFSRFGVTVTAIGLGLVQIAFLIDMTYMPFIIGLPNMGYWMMLAAFMWRR